MSDLLDFPLPIDDLETETKVLTALLAGLEKENAGEFLAAREDYRRAHEIDPGDPVPLRYLGEVERHHTGDWQAASVWFGTILARPVDPQTRAVALHGLGKMTIHADRFAEGLAMIERSTEVYPLPLAYRNLAVYWNSEGQMEKARGYAEEAMRLAPEDPVQHDLPRRFPGRRRSARGGAPHRAPKRESARGLVQPGGHPRPGG